MNQTYLTLKYPNYKLYGIFMYFYNTQGEMAAVLNTQNDEIIQDTA